MYITNYSVKVINNINSLVITINWLTFQHDWFQDGHYSGDLFTSKAIDIIQDHPTTDPLFLYLPFQNVHDPWEAPKEWIDKFSLKIEDKQRRTFAGMVAALDEAIGKVSDEI